MWINASQCARAKGAGNTLALVPSRNSEEDMRPSALALGKEDSASQSLPRVCRWNADAKHVKDCMWMWLRRRTASVGVMGGALGD